MADILFLGFDVVCVKTFELINHVKFINWRHSFHDWEELTKPLYRILSSWYEFLPTANTISLGCHMLWLYFLILLYKDYLKEHKIFLHTPFVPCARVQNTFQTNFTRFRINTFWQCLWTCTRWLNTNTLLLLQFRCTQYTITDRTIKCRVDTVLPYW